MKKLLRISVVLAMVLCLSLTAFASSTSGTRVERAVGSDGSEVEVVEGPTTETPSVEDIVGAFPGDRDLVVGDDDVDPEDLTVAWVRDLKAEIPEGGSVTITFDVPGVTDDQHVYVLHFDGSSWDLVGEGFGSVVTATFTSLSPVAILVEKAPTFWSPLLSSCSQAQSLLLP